MASVPRRKSFDETGRILPISEEEQRILAEEVNQAFNEIMEMGTEEEQKKRWNC